MNDENKEIPEAEQLRILNRFLVENPELEKLSSNLSTFNIFNILSIERAEIRHSNVLAWLMNPQGSHGLGQSFIRRILSTILLDNEINDIKLTPAQVELMELMDVEVLREWRNIDLLVFSKSNKWIMIVENKIKARVSKRQLLKYYEIVKREYPKFIVIPVILTLDADDLSEVEEVTGYITYSHAQLYHIAEYVILQRQDRVPEDAKTFLDHYLTVLRRLTMQDDEIVQLCKTIYQKHKDAIDLIVEWGATTQFGAVSDSFISNNKNLIELSTAPRRFWFVLKDWTKKMTPCSDRWKFLTKPYPIVCRFVLGVKSSKVGFIIEVGSMEDTKKRLRIINAFHKESFKVGKKGFRKEAKYTRVHSIYKKIDDPNDSEFLEKAFDDLWKKSSSEIEKTTKIIESIKW